MGYGLVNIWVKNERCQVIKRSGHLHIYDCHGVQVIPTLWFSDGHAEVMLPPGCYIVNAGIVSGNIYTDKTCFMVRCGEEACVCLIMNEFKEQQLLLNTKLGNTGVNTNAGCATRTITPYIYNANLMGIPIEEVNLTIDNLLRVAEGDINILRDNLNTEINILRNNLDLMVLEERQTVEQYIIIIEQFLMYQPL